MFLAAVDALPIGTIIIGLFGGLALFLFGMDQMADALKLVAGDGLKRILSKLTTNRFTGAFAGAAVTAIIQSSSVTTVLVVGFISAGLMSLTQSVGVIMGANIGTTITAQIIAFKVTKYALAIIAAGFTAQFLSKNEKVRHYGAMTMGLGLVFFGMSLMSDATSPLRDYEPFRALMTRMEHPLYGILLAAVFTAAVQSSSATTGLVLALALKGNISLEAGIAMIFGANIGTCVTAMLASLGKPREAVQAALVHVLFNIAGVVLWFAFIPQLAAVVEQVSPSFPDLTGADRLAAETPRQIANAHTIFNITNTVLLIWCAAPMAWLVRRLVPDRPAPRSEPSRPQYLNDLLLQTPSLATDIVRMELGRLGAAVARMTNGALKTVFHGSSDELNSLQKKDNDVDQLHAAIVTYIGRLSQENLTDSQSEQLRDYLSAANYMESIGDMIETNLVDAGRQRLTANLAISPATEELLTDFHKRVCWAVEQTVTALVGDDSAIAEEVMNAKKEFSKLARTAETHLARRLAADEPERLATFRLESEITEYLKRMYYFARRIAKLVDRQPSQEAEA
jgi:phosphate:Na+ symporter